MPWTPAQDAMLLRLQLEGKSATEMGMTFGCSRSAVLGRLWRLRQQGHGLPARVPVKRVEPKPKPPKAPRFPKEKPVTLKPVTHKENIGKPPPMASVVRKPWREAMQEAFSPLPGSTPVVWSSRPFRACAWPVGGDSEGLISCAMPTDGRTYCIHHHALAYVQTKPIDPRRYRRF